MINIQQHSIANTLTIKDGLIALDQLSSNILCLFVVDNAQRLIGTLTDGDIRRALVKGRSLTDSIECAMLVDFIKIAINEIIPAKIKICRESGIKLLPCVDEEGRILKVYNLKEKQSILPIDAVLMAGGKGERLRPLTEKTPKSLLKVGQKAIIDYNVERLMHFGVDNIHVTVNYLAEQIESHFANERDGAKITCVRESKYLGTMGAVKHIAQFEHDTILIMNSDLFTNIDLEEFYNHFKENNADMAVAAIPYSVSVPYGIFELNEDAIIGLREKPVYNYYANAGIYLIKKEVVELLPENTFYDATDCIQMLIEKEYNVVRFPLIGYWIDIGKHEDYLKVQEFIKHISHS